MERLVEGSRFLFFWLLVIVNSVDFVEMYILRGRVIVVLFIHHAVPVKVNNEKPQNQIFFPKGCLIPGFFHVALQPEAVEDGGSD